MKMKTSHKIWIGYFILLAVIAGVTLCLSLRQYRRLEPGLASFADVLKRGDVAVVVAGPDIGFDSRRDYIRFRNYRGELPEYSVRGDTLFIRGSGMLSYPGVKFIREKKMRSAVSPL